MCTSRAVSDYSTVPIVSGGPEDNALYALLASRRQQHTIRSMSKFELRQAASERSGVSYDESTVATSDGDGRLQPSIYERLGETGLRQLSQLFYDRVFADQQNAWFLGIFSSSTRQEAIENQYLFFVQTFGGPAVYKAKKGKYTRLVGRHANYNIGRRAADRWVEHMTRWPWRTTIFCKRTTRRDGRWNSTFATRRTTLSWPVSTCDPIR